jgi:hypothetical protein
MSACIDCKDFKRQPFKTKWEIECTFDKLNFFGKCQTFDSMDYFNDKPDPCVGCECSKYPCWRIA